MISPQELRKISRERGLALDLVEKDYVLGWILFGIAKNSISKHMAFKGGTALSRVYFPSQWRLSEDLDFTILDEIGLESLAESLAEEVPKIVSEASGIAVALKKTPFTNPTYLQIRFRYTGPVSKNTVKIEVSREGFVGKVLQKTVPQVFDYPEFTVNVYSLENILAETIRTLLERGKIKDYYDVWKLLKVEKFDSRKIRELFMQKCQAKSITFTGIEQFFPPDLVETLKLHVKIGLTRLSSEPLPPLEQLLEELKTVLSEFVPK